MVHAPDLQTSGAQLLDDAARQGLDTKSLPFSPGDVCARLLNHLVSAGEERLRAREAERLRSPETGVTSKLSSLTDMVRIIDEWEVARSMKPGDSCRMKGNQAQARRYRAQAAQLRQQAEAATDDVSRQHFWELAIYYEQLAEAAERESRR